MDNALCQLLHIAGGLEYLHHSSMSQVGDEKVAQV
jgi:hypothetical protein